MFTLTKDGNLCKDGKETKPEMTVREFMEAFNVPEEAFDVSKDGNVKTYNVKDTFYDIRSYLGRRNRLTHGLHRYAQAVFGNQG